MENTIVGGSRGAEEAGVGLEVKVEFERVCHVAVDNGAGLAVLAPLVCLGRVPGVDREKTHVVSFADYDERDGGTNIH